MPKLFRPDGTYLITHYDCWRSMTIDYAEFTSQMLAANGLGSVDVLVQIEQCLFRLPWTLRIDWTLRTTPSHHRRVGSVVQRRDGDRVLSTHPSPARGEIRARGWGHYGDRVVVNACSQDPLISISEPISVDKHLDLTWDALAVEVERRQREIAERA